MDTEKPLLEDEDSWQLHVERLKSRQSAGRRRLKHHHHHLDPIEDDAVVVERHKEKEYQKKHKKQLKDDEEDLKEKRKEHEESLKELWRDTGVGMETVHGMMIDAGSTGSRLHVYEWAPRVLTSEMEVQDAVSGNKLSFPGTESRWTDRLRPGLGTFATLPDSELRDAIADYLQPLLDFATTVLHSKQDQFPQFPIFLRATAGMRVLTAQNRSRVIKVVRDLFSNNTYCPFAFVAEQARVLSGEEEAIYDWTGVNFLMGDLLTESQGAGTVINPNLTHGALDLGGASTQISFYELNEDIMSNLFKLQIGQAKHWNVYAHSFLFYGMNEAVNRYQARLAAGKTAAARLVPGLYDPCLPGGSKVEIRTNIHVDGNGEETWLYNQTYPSGTGYYQATLRNDKHSTDFEMCMALTKNLLHLEKNSWCNFAHQGDCSFAGIYQPALPTMSENFGEFLAFSNYHHVWKFLRLPERATLTQLRDAAEYACSLKQDDLHDYNNGSIKDEDELYSYCFRSVYVLQLLNHGFGFQMNDTIRSIHVLNGHKVSWALGAMLYEINTIPWIHQDPDQGKISLSHRVGDVTLALLTFAMFIALAYLYCKKQARRYSQYEPVKETETEPLVRRNGSEH